MCSQCVAIPRASPQSVLTSHSARRTSGGSVVLSSLAALLLNGAPHARLASLAVRCLLSSSSTVAVSPLCPLPPPFSSYPSLLRTLLACALPSEMCVYADIVSGVVVGPWHAVLACRVPPRPLRGSLSKGPPLLLSASFRPPLSSVLV